MSQHVALTREEWTALLLFLGLPEPAGIAAATGAALADLDEAARSLIGRGLVDPMAPDEDQINPMLAAMLVVLLDAEESADVHITHPGAEINYAWYLLDRLGMAVRHDPFGNLLLQIAPAADVVTQAQHSLATLRPAAPASSQLGTDADALAAARACLVGPEPTHGELPTAAGPREVAYVGTIAARDRRSPSWREGSVEFVGLVDGGTWVLDTDGERAMLTQLRPPWPGVLSRLAPL